MHDPDLAARLLRDGHADLVSLGHGALANPDWPARLAAGDPFEPFDAAMLRPEVTIENAERWRRSAYDASFNTRPAGFEPATSRSGGARSIH